MTPKLLISVSTYEIPAKSQQWVYGVREGVMQLINALGVIPLFITPTMDRQMIKRMYDESAGVMILGGHDIHSRHYGKEQADLHTHEPDRDEFEFEILTWTLKDKKPYIGICRGMQLLNVVLGGSLHQDISRLCHTENHGLGTANALEYGIPKPQITLALEQTSRLQEFVKAQSIKALCNHHQAVDTLGNDLVASAHSSEGIVEVIEHVDKKYFCFGIESHPEADPQGGFAPVFAAFAKELQK